MAWRPTLLPQEVEIGLVCLRLLPRFLVIAADGEQLRHAFGLSRMPCGDTEVWCIARCLGLQAGKHATLRVLAIGSGSRQALWPSSSNVGAFPIAAANGNRICIDVYN